MKWIAGFSNQSDGSSLGIKHCVIMFPPSLANLLWREICIEPCGLCNVFERKDLLR